MLDILCSRIDCYESLPRTQVTTSSSPSTSYVLPLSLSTSSLLLCITRHPGPEPPMVFSHTAPPWIIDDMVGRPSSHTSFTDSPVTVQSPSQRHVWQHKPYTHTCLLVSASLRPQTPPCPHDSPFHFEPPFLAPISLFPPSRTLYSMPSFLTPCKLSCSLFSLHDLIKFSTAKQATQQQHG